MVDPGPPPPGRISDIREFRNSFIGMTVLACSPFLIFGTWPLYGAAGALPLFALWVVLFVPATRAFQTNPNRVLLLGVVSVIAWVGVVLLNRL